MVFRSTPTTASGHRLIEDLPHIVWMSWPDGRTDYVNALGCEYTGLSLADISGLRWGELIHPDDVAEASARWNEAVDSGRPFQTECRVRRADGDFRWLALRAVGLRDAEGRVNRWLGTATDIESERRLSVQLRSAEERSAETLMLLETLQSAAPVGFAFIDREFRIARVNNTLAAHSGLSVEEQLGRPIAEVMPELWPQLEPVYRSVVETGQSFVNLEVSIQAPAEPHLRRHALASFYPVRIRQQVAGIGVVVVDITDRQRAEAAQARLAAIVESSHDAIISVDLDGTILTWNAGARALYGYEATEIIGQSFSGLMPDDQTQEVTALLAQIASGDDVRHFESMGVRKDGSLVPIAVAMSPILDGGRLVGASSLSHDITERQRLRAQLEEARDAALNALHAKSQFLTNISHELRTPMTVIVGMTELLLLTDLDEDQRMMLDTVQRRAESLLQTIGDLLDMSSLTTGDLRLESVAVDVRLLVNDLGESLGPAARAKGLGFLCACDDDVPAVIPGDPRRIRQMLLQLGTNAVKFTDHGKVVIRASRPEGLEVASVRFTVSDTGIGVAPGDQWRLFRLFSQVDPSDTRRFGGNGLGLALVAQLAQAMGGTVGVASSPGRGSTFWFDIPVL